MVADIFVAHNVGKPGDRGEKGEHTEQQPRSLSCHNPWGSGSGEETKAEQRKKEANREGCRQ